MKSDLLSWNKGTDISTIISETERLGLFTGLEQQDADTLRLLAEEMLGLTRGILAAHPSWGDYSGTFSVENTGKDFTLCLTVKAPIDADTRADFLATAKDGKNDSEKGILGKLRGAFERMILMSDTDLPGTDIYLAHGTYGLNSGSEMTWWSVNAYSSVISRKQKAEEWDGMEKNILIGVADDVIVGVTLNGAELHVRKNFSK